MQYTWNYSSPLGEVVLAANGDKLVGLWFSGQKAFGSTLAENREEKLVPVLQETCTWLNTYFAGKKPKTTPALEFIGTAFQKKVWEQLLQIPYGSTVTYGQLAKALGKPKAARAIGGAVGSNPISLVVPCHRVIGTDGSLTGYAGGLERKTALLKLEGALK